MGKIYQSGHKICIQNGHEYQNDYKIPNGHELNTKLPTQGLTQHLSKFAFWY
jgi:hypothetical protein